MEPGTRAEYVRVRRRRVQLLAGLGLTAGLGTLLSGLILADDGGRRWSSASLADSGAQIAPAEGGRPVALVGQPAIQEDVSPGESAPLLALPLELLHAAETMRAAREVAPIQTADAVAALPPAPEAPEPPPARPAPTDVRTLLHDDRTGDPTTLRTWIADRTLPAAVRYTALRLLEEHRPALAQEAARGLLDDPESLVRLNAVAVLARSDQPGATEALAQLDPRTRRLAQKLAERR